MPPRSLARVLGFGVLGWAGLARAQGDSAQVQFDYGLSEMLAGRYATGCPALASSQQRDPRPGTLFTLGECELRWGHPVNALQHLTSFLDEVARIPSSAERARQAERAQIASAQRADLERTVARLTIVLPEAMPPLAIVRQDGIVVPRSTMGAPLVVDPGEHVLELALGDGHESAQRITLSKGEVRRVVLAMPDVIAPPAPVAEVLPSPPPAADQPAPPTSHGREWAWVAGGIGVTGLAVGGVAAAVAIAEKSKADSVCGTGHLAAGECTTQAGVAAGNSSRTWATVSTVGFAVGAAGVVTGLVVWLASPAKATASRWQPVVGLGPGGEFVGAQRAW